MEWRRNWPVVVASVVGFSYLGLMTYSLSLMMEPLALEFGWSRTFISSGFSLSTFTSAILAPIFGVALDRWGVRRLALPGIATTSLFIAAFGLLTGAAWQWYMLWMLYAVFSVATKQTTWIAAVTGRFNRARGLAVGITTSGSALTQVAVPPLCLVLIGAVGWRWTYVALGLGWGLATFVVAWLFLREPDRTPTRTPTRTSAAAEPVAAVPVESEGLTLAEAWRDRGLWSIAITTLVIMALTIGFSIHQVPILMGAGVSRGQAALLVGMVGVAGLGGRLLTGVLLDRFRANWVGGLTLAVTASSFAVLVHDDAAPAMIFVAMLINGYTQGAKVQLSSYLTARYAGMRAFGTIFGFMSAIMTLGAGMGPLLAGYAFDSTGSYGIFLIGSAIACAASGALLISLPTYPAWAKAPPEPAALPA